MVVVGIGQRRVVVVASCCGYWHYWCIVVVVVACLLLRVDDGWMMMVSYGVVEFVLLMVLYTSWADISCTYTFLERSQYRLADYVVYIVVNVGNYSHDMQQLCIYYSVCVVDKSISDVLLLCIIDL